MGHDSGSYDPGSGGGTVTKTYGYVPHRIRRAPDSEATAAARCLHDLCQWKAEPSTDVGHVDDQCMQHMGLNTDHTHFARTFSDVAVVARLTEEHGTRRADRLSP